MSTPYDELFTNHALLVDDYKQLQIDLKAADARATAAEKARDDVREVLTAAILTLTTKLAAAEQERDEMVESRDEAISALEDHVESLQAKLAAAERREAEKDQRIENMASQFEADATNAPDRSERLSLRFCAKNLQALASPSTPSQRPTHTADGKEIVGWTAPQPSHPIVRATPTFHGGDIESDERIAVQPSTPSPAPSAEGEP